MPNRRPQPPDPSEPPAGPRRWKRLLPALLLLTAGVLSLPAFLVLVPEGRLGIRARGAQRDLIPPGLHLRIPFLDRIRTQPAGAVTAGVEVRIGTPGGTPLTLKCTGTGRLDLDHPDAWGTDGEGIEARIGRILSEDLGAWGPLLPAGTLLLHGPDPDTLHLLEVRLARAGIADGRVECDPAAGPPPPGFPEVRREPGSVPTGARILLVGLDGADWRVIRPLLERGVLPHLEGLLRKGVAGEVRSFRPMLSPLLWTTVVTGVSPDRHGILDFLVTDPATGDPVPIPANFRRAQAIWNVATEHSRTSSWVGWWATWPAEAVAGTMVSDRVAYSLFEFSPGDRGAEGAIAPGSDGQDLGPLRVDPGSIRFEEVTRFVEITPAEFRQARSDLGGPVGASYRNPVTHLLRILAATRTYHGIARALLARGQPDWFGVFYQGIDEVSHRFAHFMPPRMAMVSAADQRKFGRAVERFYAWQDELLGEILGAVDPDTLVVVLSDHGFLSGPDRPEGLPPDIEGKPDRWHRLHGILILAGGPVRGGPAEPPEAPVEFRPALAGVTLYDVAPTLLYAGGLPISREMPGTPLFAALDPGFVATTPVHLVDSYGPVSGRAEGTVPRSAADAEILARFRSLGYLGGEEDPATAPGGSGGRNTAATYHANRAFLKLEGGDPAGARAEVEQALALKPDYLPALGLRARALEAEGSHREALAAARALLEAGARQGERQPGTLVMMARLFAALGMAAEGESEMEGLVPVLSPDPEILVAVATLRRARGDVAGAAERYAEAVRLDPGGNEAVRGLFFLHLQAGDLDEAERLVRGAVSLSPRSVVHRNLLGLLHMERGEAEAAEAEFRTALSIEPEDVSTLANLGALFGRRGRLEEAVEVLRRAAGLDPRHREALVNLAGALGRLGRLEEVILLLESARSRGVESPEILNALGLAYLQSGRRGEAEAAFRASLDLRPDQPAVRSVIEGGSPTEAPGTPPGGGS